MNCVVRVWRVSIPCAVIQHTVERPWTRPGYTPMLLCRCHLNLDPLYSWFAENLTHTTMYIQSWTCHEKGNNKMNHHYTCEGPDWTLVIVLCPGRLIFYTCFWYTSLLVILLVIGLGIHRCMNVSHYSVQVIVFPLFGGVHVIMDGSSFIRVLVCLSFPWTSCSRLYFWLLFSDVIVVWLSTSFHTWDSIFIFR